MGRHNAGRRVSRADLAAQFEQVEREIDEARQKAEAGIQAPPTDWMLGQLLNVRNNGSEYVVTLLGEEFDYQHPERALKFGNSVDCQNFVSAWYARTYAPPLAR